MPSNPLLQTSATLVAQEQPIPYDGEGQALAAAGEAIVDAVGQIKTAGVQDQLQDVTDEAIQAAAIQAQAAKGPIGSDAIADAIGGTPEQVDDPDNAVIRPVLESIARLKRANEQGSINVDEVMIRQENILREAIARHPTFAARFIQGAQQQLGYNPIGSTIEAIARGQQRTGKPKTQADEIEEYYEKQGDELNVDRTLKFSNPAAWYTAVQKEIRFNENLQRTTRTYQLAVTTKQLKEEEALFELRENVMPQYGRAVVKDLYNGVQHLATMSAEERNKAYAAGELDIIRKQAAAARVGLYDHISKMNRNLGNYLTQPQINEAARDVLVQLEYIEKATDPVQAMQGIKTHLEAVAYQMVDFKFPEIAVLERTATILAKFPDGSLVSKKFNEEMSTTYAVTLSRIMGGVLNGENPNTTTPQTVVPPGVGDKLTATQKADVKRGTYRTVLAGLRSTPSDVTMRRAAVRTVGMAAADYFTHVRTAGMAPDTETVEESLKVVASDEFYDIVADPDVPMTDIATIKPMTDVVAAETLDTGIEIGTELQGAIAPDLVRPGRGGYPQGYKSVPLNEVISIEWLDGRAQFKSAPENDLSVMDRKIDFPNLNKKLAALNAKYSQRMTLLVRGIAHTSGSNDYNNYTIFLDREFERVSIMIPE